MAFLLAFVNIVAYLAAPPAGFATVVVTMVIVGVRRGRSRLEKLLTMLVLTMPLYALPVLPGLHHVASWTTLLLVALLVMVIPHITRMSPVILVALFIIVAFSILTGLSSGDGADGWYYIAQFLMFTVPAVIVYEARSWIRATLDKDAANRLLSTLASTQLALAIGVLVQWQLHSRLGISLGSISFFAERVTYDLTVSAYSVLSGLLAIGIVLAPTLWRRGRWKMAVILAVVSSFAIVVNSSRTGIIVGAVVLGLAILFPPKGARRFGARLAIVPAGILAWWMYDLYAGSVRGREGFLDDNGRFETFRNAFDRMMATDENFLLGVGYADYEGVAPHNFVVETLVSSGVIVSAVVFALIVGLLVYLRQSEWQYSIWALLGASMLFAGFYAVKAAAVIAVLMLALRAADNATQRGDVAPPAVGLANQERPEMMNGSQKTRRTA
ncbi:O-antigen ligase family protein [Microbacterium maritypicum]|uniref:O-antigen ligase family protein n=1 Tax=Microbacterium maritypicum TaxID=33918 RepID=UPI003558AA91